MKRIFKTSTAVFMMAAMALTACDNESDIQVNDLDQVKHDKEWTSVFGDIDKEQDWSLASSVKATIEVYSLDASSEYRLHLYTANPLTDSNAMLLGQATVTTDAAGNAKASFDVDVTKGETVFYASYIDKENRRSVKPVALIDCEIKAQFGQAATRASLSSDALVIPSVESPESEVMAKYSQAKELNNTNININWDGDANYAGVLKISKGNTWNGQIGILGSNGNLARTIYVEGTWAINGWQQLGGGGLIVVCQGGKINITSNGTIKSDNGGRIVVLPGGAIEGDGSIEFCNGSGDSFDYNAGSIKIGKMNNNGGRMFNYGVMTIGELQGGSGLSTYINHNQMTVDHSTYGSKSANTRILNECQLNVTNDLCCKIINIGEKGYVNIGGDLRMSGSWDGTQDAAEIVMAKNTQLKVAGGVALNNASIVGPTDGWAICEFGEIGDPDNLVATNYTTSWNTGSEQLTEGYVINNLKISIDKTENIDNYYNLTPYGKFTMVMMNGRLYDVQYAGNASNNWAQIFAPVYRANAQAGNGNATLINKGEAPINIPQSDCGAPAYTSKPGDEIEINPQYFVIGCEDLGNSADRDFNDIVFSVAHAAGSTELLVTPLAAGGTLPSNIYYDGQLLGETHALLGETNTQVMINTNGTITNVGQTVSIPVPADWSFEENRGKFSVRVRTPKGTINEVKIPKTGESPFLIIVPCSWQWPVEKMNIEDAYPGFTEWSKNASINAQWISTRVDGRTVVRK